MAFRAILPSAQSQSVLNSAVTLLRNTPLYRRSLVRGLTEHSRKYDALSMTSLLSDIWESILRAVPKKKTSHMKKRHRQMAGKALKDVTSLTRCSACGHIKRAHHLCPYCVKGEAAPVLDTIS